MSKRIMVPSEVFSRVSGYYRPVNQWNRGKREEFSQRLCADVVKLQGDLSLLLAEAEKITA
ncbi:MAG TPA: anaerobic ribonucleoside-triphosphate reductase [Spirochaetota bacterium]|nr:hypothetical protein [Spirochaetota bacterium]HQO39134.1 anaerobic ribonucleoside-triphosphate reductase [Spirochaetota bacterium]